MARARTAGVPRLSSANQAAPRLFVLVSCLMADAEKISCRVTLALLWLTPAVVGVCLLLFEPGRWGFYPVCPFRALTGFTCPGCGSTRALYHLVHGELTAAFQLNPLLIVSLPLLLYALIRHTNIVLRGQPIRGNTLHPKYIWALFSIILFFWVFRNTPFYPFVS